MFGRDSKHSSARARAHSKRVSRDLSQATIGTHARRGTDSSRRARRADRDLGLSSRRRSAHAERGEIQFIRPKTTSFEPASSYARRSNQLDLASKTVKRERMRRRITVLVIALVVIGIAAGAGFMTYNAQVSSKLSLQDEEVQKLLVPVNPEKPEIFLIEADFTDPRSQDAQADLVALAYFDQEKKSLTFVNIPAQLVLAGNNGNHALKYSLQQGGDGELIRQLNAWTGSKINHLVKTNATLFQELVDSLGGIDVDLPEEVDDPRAGTIFIPKGMQHLNGEAALVAARARNYKQGDATRADIQLKLMQALFDKFKDAQPSSIPGMIDAAANGLRTDISAGDLGKLVDASRGFNADSIRFMVLPGEFSRDDQGGYSFYVAKKAWGELSARLNARETPELPRQEEEAPQVDPLSFTITVRNGSGITGAASSIKERLEARHFKVTETGNADSYVYNDTIIVYKDDKFKAAAQAVKAAIGAGRVTDQSVFYSFNTDILVMVGKDFKPE